MDLLMKREIAESFNGKPKNGINKIKEWCANNNKDFAEETAKFFYEEKNNLNLESVGDYLGTDGGDNKKVLESFTKQFGFKEKDYLESLREFLESFKLPGEAQKIDRLVESFGTKYHEQNPNGEVKGKDAAYILAFQTIMLNTDLHSSSIPDSKKMTFEQLKNNLRGTNEKQNFNDDFLRKIYDEIKANPFKLNFTEIATGYEIADINSQNDKTFKKLDDFLTTKTDIHNVFPNLTDNLTAEHKQPKTWLNKFTGYEGSVLIKDGNAEVEIQIYKPNILSKWFLGEKNKLVIQPKQQSEQSLTEQSLTEESLKLAAQIAASFETKVTSIKATYDYLKEDLKKQYENPKKELEKAMSVVELHNNMKEITKKVQKEDPEIPDTRSMPLASRENFKDLVQAELGKTKPSKPLSFDEELKKKVMNRQEVDLSKPQIKNTEEKIDNHVKRLEELKQKQQDLETRRKELEEKKANASTREEKWKITGELEGISNHLRSIEKEHNTINTAAEREKQFNTAQSYPTKNEPTAADLQQQGAMEAIKRMKEQKTQEAAANKTATNETTFSINPTAQSLKPGVIPPPPLMPNLNNKNTTLSQELQKEVKNITKQIPEKEAGYKKELENTLKKRKENQNPSRGI